MKPNAQFGRIFSAFLFALISALSAIQAQTSNNFLPLSMTEGMPIETHSHYYNQAYLEMAAMLDAKQSLSIKRAVFLQEWAYLDGNLDYEAFCQGVDTVAMYLKKFIAVNALDQYHTGDNYALFEYFARPYSGNGYKPFSYDFDDFGGAEDYTKVFVSKAMRTHSGQCRSLPLYYKILAEAIGAQAHITLAPQHFFIRHPDEADPDKWINVELTGPSFSRDIWLIEQFGISETAIRNKVYMYPLTDKETVAFLLAELSDGYLRKYDYDYLMWLCATKSLAHYPQNVYALTAIANMTNLSLMEYLSTNGNVMDDYARAIDAQWYRISDKITALGWSEMDNATYDRLLRGVEEQMEKAVLDSADVR